MSKIRKVIITICLIIVVSDLAMIFYTTPSKRFHKGKYGLYVRHNSLEKLCEDTDCIIEGKVLQKQIDKKEKGVISVRQYETEV